MVYTKGIPHGFHTAIAGYRVASSRKGDFAESTRIVYQDGMGSNVFKAYFGRSTYQGDFGRASSLVGEP